MPITLDDVLHRSENYYLNICTKHLARYNQDARHIYAGIGEQDPISRIAEAWRFPAVKHHLEANATSASQRFNEVSFIFYRQNRPVPNSVGLVGTFHLLSEPLALNRVGDTPFFALTLRIPRGEIHHYRYLVDGEIVLDPINPQRATLDNGKVWSRFFTMGCSQPLVFERWEWQILSRLVEHILPFQTQDAQNFLERHFQSLDDQARAVQFRHDQDVGVVNYIDKLLAKEESHHLQDYRICLELIAQLLRQRNPVQEPWLASKNMYVELYDQMSNGGVPGWNYSRYNNPRYFLQLLRRHALTGAFSHPDYGGNAGASAWAFLSEQYRDQDGKTLFDWRRAQAAPLGNNPAYRG